MPLRSLVLAGTLALVLPTGAGPVLAAPTPATDAVGVVGAAAPAGDPGAPSPDAFTEIDLRRPGTTDREVAAYWTPERMRAATPLVRKTTQRTTATDPRQGAAASGTGPDAVTEPQGYSDPTTPTVPHAWAPYATPPSSVGRIYLSTPSGNNYCSASVVNSPAGNLVMTAAHCLGSAGGYGYGAVFAPRYTGGATSVSLGVFPVQKVTMKTPFNGGSGYGTPDDRYDYAFLTVGRSSVSGRTVQVATGGALLLTTTRADTRPVQAWGYQYGESSPRTCTVSAPVVSKPLSGIGSHPFRALGCNPFGSGVSGGPFYLASGTMVPGGAHPPVLMGNVGGWVGGGWDSETSYSVLYRHDVLNAWLRASGLAGWADSTRRSFAGALAVGAGNFTRTTGARKDFYTVWPDGSVTVQIGTGDSNAPFSLPVRLAGPQASLTRTVAASVGDLNGDRRDDLVVTLADGTVKAFMDVSHRSLSLPVTLFTGGSGSFFSGVTSTQATDLDSTGVADDVVVLWGGGARKGALVHYRNPLTYGTARSLTMTGPGSPNSAGFKSIAFGGLDDSMDDLVALRADGSQVTMRAYRTSGFWQRTATAGPDATRAAARTFTIGKMHTLATESDTLLRIYPSSDAIACFRTLPTSVGSCGPRKAQY